MRHVVDTGVFSAAPTVAELRHGALVAAWGTPRRNRLEEAIAATTVAPVSDALLTRVAELRLACRHAGHPLADPAHANDLWIATSALHIAAALVSADAIFDDVPNLDLMR